VNQQLSPSPQVTYLGFVVDSQAMKLFLPMWWSAARMHQHREIAKVVETLPPTCPAVLPAPLYYQNLAING